jgi:hypothetical protein
MIDTVVLCLMDVVEKFEVEKRCVASEDVPRRRMTYTPHTT